jgi:hypothetical protein
MWFLDCDRSFLGRSSEAEGGPFWVGPFVMAMVMGNCVRRSNALLGCGAGLAGLGSCEGQHPKSQTYGASQFGAS